MYVLEAPGFSSTKVPQTTSVAAEGAADAVAAVLAPADPAGTAVSGLADVEEGDVQATSAVASTHTASIL